MNNSPIKENIKLTIEVLGVCIGLYGFYQFTKTSDYTVGIIVLIASIAIVIFIHYYYMPSRIYKAVETHFEILDDKGHHTKGKKVNKILIKDKNVTQLNDHNFKVSPRGSISFIGSNIGTLQKTVNEGGSFSVTTNFDFPLELNKTIIHEIYYDAFDTLTESSESVSHDVHSDYDYVMLTVKFPSTRPPRNISGIRNYRGEKHQVLPETTQNGLLVTLKADKPRIGSRYIITWDW
jgi:hypothetical protein